MYKLIKVGKRTFYIDGQSKVGIYVVKDNDVCLIDSGADEEAGIEVENIIETHNWNPIMIINTHSHADHIGGNDILQQKYYVPVYSVGMDKMFIEHPILEPSFIYGGYPNKEMRDNLLTAEPSVVEVLGKDNIPDGMEVIRLDGSSYMMYGFKTSDDVWFIADSLASKNLLEKEHIKFLCNVEEYLETLEKLKNLEGKLFITSYSQPTKDIKQLVEYNYNSVQETINLIKGICKGPVTFEDILKYILDYYQLFVDFTKYAIYESTIRTYISYLFDKGEIKYEFNKNKLFYSVV